MEKNVKYILLGLLVAALTKSLIVGTNINEVLLIAILASLTAFYEIKINKKDLTDLQNQINKLNTHNEIQDKTLDDLKSSMVSVKVSSGVRSFGTK